MACPNLTGHYICQSDRAKDLIISQTETADGIVYDVSNAGHITTVLANGIEQSVKINNFEGTISYSCEGDSLKIIEKGELYEEESLVGYMNAESTLKINSSGSLVSSGEAKLTHWNERYVINLGYECAPIEQSILSN